MYKRGYAAEGLESARAEMDLGSLEHDRNMIPEVIHLRSQVRLYAIRTFQPLSSKLAYCAVLPSPFILDGSGSVRKRNRVLYKSNTLS